MSDAGVIVERVSKRAPNSQLWRLDLLQRRLSMNVRKAQTPRFPSAAASRRRRLVKTMEW
jgi:hypothetical protein